MALRFVLAESKKELTSLAPSTLSRPTSPAKTNTQRRRKSSGTKSPVYLRTTGRRSSASEDDIEPEEHLMRNLGVSIPTDATSEHARTGIFERALFDRLGKLEIHTTNLQNTTESSISSHLADAQSTLQLLQDSLLAESLYHKVQLLDPDVELSIDTFEDDLKALQEEMEAINLQKIQTRNVNREQLIKRWSR